MSLETPEVTNETRQQIRAFLRRYTTALVGDLRDNFGFGALPDEKVTLIRSTWTAYFVDNKVDDDALLEACIRDALELAASGRAWGPDGYVENFDRFIAYCFTEPLATFTDATTAKNFVESHISRCRHGALSAVTWLWHLADDGTWSLSADGEWLGHDVRKASEAWRP